MYGTSGVLSIVKRDLEPKMVFNHPSRRVLGVQIKCRDGNLMIFNIYVPNSAKLRMQFWRDLNKLGIEGEWCFLSNFNMVDIK